MTAMFRARPTPSSSINPWRKLFGPARTPLAAESGLAQATRGAQLWASLKTSRMPVSTSLRGLNFICRFGRHKRRAIARCMQSLESPGDPRGLVSSVRREMSSLDPNLPLSQIRLMDEVLSLAQSRPAVPYAIADLLFSGVALAIATVGIYGVISYSVERRSQGIWLAHRAGRAAVGRIRTGDETRRGPARSPESPPDWSPRLL